MLLETNGHALLSSKHQISKSKLPLFQTNKQKNKKYGHSSVNKQTITVLSEV